MAELTEGQAYPRLDTALGIFLPIWARTDDSRAADQESMPASQVFVGRAHELSGLRSALDGNARLVLVVGDAGVGKTRFVAEGLGSAGGLTAWGACLPLAEKLPFLPVAEALDALSRLDGGAPFERALDIVPPYARVEAARLLPRLQPSDTSQGGRAEGWQRGRLFSGVAELLAAVARQGRLVLVIEDLQWADSATLDFLLFATRAGRSDAMTVVATCRSDEMAVDPQVAQWLAHMRGGGQVAEIRLGPLSRDEVAQQVTGLMGAPPPAQMADEVYARSEGNPFFAEQLVADALARPAGTGLGRPGGLPTRLAELLTARADVCRSDARTVLAALAVAGCPLTEDQLSGVAGLGLEAVRTGLQELAAARLLAETEPDGRRYRARHALLAEAVAAGLLPGERLALHERTARALEKSGEEGLAAEAADHWAAAGRVSEELRARVTAGAAAERVFGYAEAAAHWQRAIELCQAEPTTDDKAGICLPGLYVRAIDARYISGRAEDASALAEEAYRRFAGHQDPATNAIIHERAARFRGLAAAYLGGQEAPGPSVELITEALRLFEQAAPSAEHAEALFYYGHFLFVGQGQVEDGINAVNRGLEIAEAAGATALIPRLLSIFAYHKFLQGQMDEGFAVLRRCRALTGSAGDSEAGILIDIYESDVLLKTCRFSDAADVARRGLREARQAGLEDFWNTAILTANAAEALVHQGRTAEAGALVDPLTQETPTADHWLVHLYRAEIDRLRGDIEAARRRQQQIRDRIGHVGNFDRSREAAQRTAELALWTGRPGEALAEVQRTTARADGSQWAIFCGRLLVAGMRACADLAELARARRDEPAVAAAEVAADALAASVAQMTIDPFAEHPFAASIPAERATWDAERTRLAGSSDPMAWSAAVKAWADLRWPHRAGYAGWRHAEALLDEGRTREAAAALQAAAAAAEGHAPLLTEIRKLARRARIPLDAVCRPAPGEVPAAARPAGRYGLTDRELVVLRLLTAGLTNAQIGAELFISPKTASVHVTSILRKLDATGRVQAAALAERVGLLDDEQA
jgi:DNA-binding CsgD family transcriptional regulator